MSLSSDAAHRLQRARADWARAAASWAELCASGATLVARVTACRGAALERAAQPWESDGDADDDGYPASLAEPCRRLADCAAGLRLQLERLRQAASQLEALRQLEALAACRAGDGPAPAGDAARCAAAAATLLPMYERELRVKSTVAAWVAHADSQQALTAFQAAWTHDAYMSPDSRALEQCLFIDATLEGSTVGGGGGGAMGASPLLRSKRV